MCRCGWEVWFEGVRSERCDCVRDVKDVRVRSVSVRV